MKLFPYVEWDLDDATYKFALSTLSSISGDWKKGLLSISSISRSIPRLCGVFNIGSVTLTFDNATQFFSQLKDGRAWRGRTMRIRLGDVEGPIADFQPAYTGVVDDFSFQNDEMTVTIVDNSLDLFNVPVTKTLRRLVAGGYPDTCPLYSKGELIPYVAGLCQAPVGSVDNGGQLPAYNINEAAWIYAAAIGDVSATVENVYVYGVKQTPTTDYVVETRTPIGGGTITVFVFAADPRDLVNHTTDEVEVTWSGGSAEQRPIYQLETYLADYVGITADQLDTTSWNECKTEFDDRGYVGTLVVTKNDFTHMDVVARHLRSNGLQLFRKRNGLWALNFIGLSKSSVLTLTPKQFVKGGFKQSSYTSDTLASRLHLNYDYNYSSPGNEFFGHTPDIISAAEIINLGSDIAVNISLWFGRSFDGDPATPLSIGALYLSLMRENGLLIENEIPTEFFDDIDLGDVYLDTHWAGVGAAGFTEKRIVVLGTRLTPSPARAQLILIGYVEPDPPTDSPELSADFGLGGGLTVEEIEAA